MKKNTILSLVAGAILLTSCGGGVSEEFKKEIATFETEWNEATKSAESFGAALAEKDSTCKMEMEHMMVPDSIKANATPEMMASIDSMATACGNQTAKIEEIKTTFDGFKAGWDKDGADFATWKAGVEKGEVKEEEAKTKLEEWKKKLAEAKNNIAEWTTSLDAVKAECEATCKAHHDAVMAIPAAPADKKGDKKKMK